jgi:hypothetical protein
MPLRVMGLYDINIPFSGKRHCGPCIPAIVQMQGGMVCPACAVSLHQASTIACTSQPKQPVD